MDRKVGGAVSKVGGSGGRSKPIPIPGGRGCGTEKCPIVFSNSADSSPFSANLAVIPPPAPIDISSDESDSPGVGGTLDVIKPESKSQVHRLGTTSRSRVPSGSKFSRGAVGDGETLPELSAPLACLKLEIELPPLACPTLDSLTVPLGTSPRYVDEGIFKFVFLKEKEQGPIAPTLFIVLGAEDFTRFGVASSVKLNNTICTVAFPEGGYAYVPPGGQVYFQCGEDCLSSVDATEGFVVEFPPGACVSFGSNIGDFDSLCLNEADVMLM